MSTSSLVKENIGKGVKGLGSLVKRVSPDRERELKQKMMQRVHKSMERDKRLLLPKIEISMANLNTPKFSYKNNHIGEF